MARLRVKTEVTGMDMLKSFGKTVSEAIEQLMVDGRQRAEDAGIIGDVLVNANGADSSIIAIGDEIYISEFGAGDAVENTIMGEGAEYPIEPGSWSRVNMHLYERFGYWYYGGVRLREVRPTRPMLHAWEYISDNAESEIERMLAKYDRH